MTIPKDFRGKVMFFSAIIAIIIVSFTWIAEPILDFETELILYRLANLLFIVYFFVPRKGAKNENAKD